MESSSNSKKEKKGFGRIWTKVKLAIRPKSKSKAKATAAESAGSSNPQTAPPTQSSQRFSRSLPLALTDTDQDSTALMESENKTQSPAGNPPPPPPPVMPSNTPEIQIDPAGIAPEELDSNPTVENVESSSVTKEYTTQASSGQEMSSSQKQDLERRYERAQAIFRKYNLELDEASWEMHPKIQVERVLRPARIRVRWTCHECKTTFGHDKICVECAHQRCKTCARYPPKKKKSRTAKKAAIAATQTDVAGSGIRQGACHECQTAFDLGTQECSNCHHKICERCLQEILSVIQAEEAQAIPAT